MRKVMLLALLLSLISCVSYAGTFEIDVNQPNVQAVPGETTAVNFSVISQINDTILFTPLNLKTWMTWSTGRKKVTAGKEEIVQLLLSPPEDVGWFINSPVKIIAKSDINKGRVEKQIYVSIPQGGVEKGKINVIEVIVDGNFTPTGTIISETRIKNNKEKTFQNGVLELDAESLGQVQKKVERIDPGQIVTINHIFDVEDNFPSGNYRIEAKLYEEGSLIDSAHQEFPVQEKAIIKTKEESFPVLFGLKTKIILENKGNIADDYTVEKSLGIGASFFYGDAPRKINGTCAWTRTVGPGESVVINYSVNFWPLVLLLVILGVVYYVLMFFIKTARIKKFIMHQRKIEEGKEFTIGVEVKNKTGKKIKDVVVRDFVPSVFKIRKAKGVQPDAAKKTKSGNELIWRLKSLAPGDERVLSYKIVPVFGLNSKLSLTRANVKYKEGDERKTVYSNTPSLGEK